MKKLTEKLYQLEIKELKELSGVINPYAVFSDFQDIRRECLVKDKRGNERFCPLWKCILIKTGVMSLDPFLIVKDQYQSVSVSKKNDLVWESVKIYFSHLIGTGFVYIGSQNENLPKQFKNNKRNGKKKMGENR